jgi:hypothetical protein
MPENAKKAESSPHLAGTIQPSISSITPLMGSKRQSLLASNLGLSRNLSAELHRRVRNFATACAERDSSNNSGNYESALHVHSLLVNSLGKCQTSASHVHGGRNVGTELHRRMGNFSTASPQRDSADNRRKYDQPLNTMHGFLQMLDRH